MVCIESLGCKGVVLPLVSDMLMSGGSYERAGT